VLGRVLRHLRRQTRRWSSESDRVFHDQAFAGGPADPFTFAYPGYVTIRRFADLASARMDGVSRVIDVGCGPGEITCELARRFPGCRFQGVDHSGVAIERARAHAARLGLSNVSFMAGDALAATGAGAVDVVMMFDSFHHLLDPAAFIERMGQVTRRFVLVEPAGTRLGGWGRSLDADWIASDFDTVRARAEHLLGCPRQPLAESAPAPHAGEAVEHRYTLDDFERLFEGYGLEVRGTVAGFDVYPPASGQQTPLAERMGRYAYELVTEIDDELRRRGRDLEAKHWVIDAERGRVVARRRAATTQSSHTETPAVRLQGAFDVHYVAVELPATIEAGTVVHGRLTLENRSWRTWASVEPAPIQASYHWWRTDQVELARDGLRSPLPKPVAPGETVTLAFRVRAPERPGRYRLAVDLVEEGVAWFSDAGVAPLTLRLTVRPGA
jgi:SAM-dependent methyltransferase